MWVEPHPILIFTPFGSLLITYVSAPNASNTLLAIVHALPFEQSSPTLMFLKEFFANVIRYPIYLFLPAK